MSVARRLLNPYLRFTEKRYMERAEEPAALRRNFEFKARLFFRAPFGTRYERGVLGGVPVQWARAKGVRREAGPLMLHLHGGGYVFGSSTTHRAMLGRLSALAGLPACLPDYRLAPEHPFPAAVEDALAVYRAVEDWPGGVVIGGDSAGGGLALAVVAEVLRAGGKLPLGVFAMSPLTDMGFTGESMRTNAAADVMLPASRAAETAEMYLDGADAEDPRASPLFADFTGGPPVWLCVGDTEILLDDTRRMAERLAAQGVEVEMRIEHDLPHVWPYFQGLMPEAMVTLREIAEWISSLSRRRGGS
ncbi:alpha/beta hydrolase [Roseovarius sp.]|uniref:alpha/beta hydrolase n=1 Tax=Roseovarius sp. TaxID=1486281 RepID=UPI00262551CE|nr:alpha/beta hydrolase [Roseovarius sp.]MDM8167282.1 alpha/beta hydrolase [Roseovarius sp.]